MGDELAKAITEVIYPPLKSEGFQQSRRCDLICTKHGIVQRLYLQISGLGDREFRATACASILLLAVTSLAGCKITSPEAERQKIGCDILVDWVNKRFSERRRPSLLREPKLVSPLDMESTVKSLQSEDLPADEIRREVEEHNRVIELSPATTCPALTKILPISERKRPGPDDLQIERSLQLTVPHVQLDRGIAYFEIDYECGLCGGQNSTITYFANERGKWEMGHIEQHSVS